jgi:regulator of protease activity HflC (stomatin/prohibitin superfamily)
MFVSQVPGANAGASHGLHNKLDLSLFHRLVEAQTKRRNNRWALKELGLEPLPEVRGDLAGLSMAGRQDARALRGAQSDDGGVSDEGGGDAEAARAQQKADAEAAAAAARAQQKADAEAAAAAARAQQEADDAVSPLSHTLAAVAVVLSHRTAATVGVVSEAPTFLFL